jgi:putative spermidine/putrescine transport system permease protein
MPKPWRELLLALVALAAVLPLVPVLLWAFAGTWRFPQLLPAAWTLRGFADLAEPGERVAQATLTSLYIALAVTGATLLAALPAGMAIGGYRFWLKGPVIALVLLPILVPPLAAALGIHMTFIRLGLADSAVGVLLVHLIPSVPYATLVIASVFAGRSGAAEETARTLGAGPSRTFLYITLPQVLPGIAVAALLAFLISWSQYILTVLIGGGSVLTLPMVLFSAASGNDPVITAALALVFVAPAVLALSIALRYLKTEAI